MLHKLSLIVRGTDTDAKDLTSGSQSLELIATAFHLVYQDDHEQIEREFPVYDAL